MPRRFSGSLRIYIQLPSADPYYTVRVTYDGRRIGSTSVGLPLSDRRCEDDPSVIDEVAHAALTFLDADGVDFASYAGYTDTGWDVRRKVGR